MILREWKFTDLKAICDFHKKNFKDAWSYKSLASSFLSDRFKGFLFEKDGEIIGTVSFDYGIDQADVLNLVIKEEERRKGLATRLMQRLFEETAKIELKTLFLEVRESNLPAIKTYEKLGFTKVSVRKNYYQDNENAIVMKKEFSYNEY